MAALSSSRHSNPYYYPYPSTVGPRAFVTVTLSGRDNYLPWKAQMLSLIQCQELEGFINGSILMPTGVATDEDYLSRASWKRSDKLVKAWILSSLEEKVLKRVADLETAKDVWTRLELTYDSRADHPNVEDTEYCKYLDLYKAAIKGSWPDAQLFLDKERGHEASSRAIENPNDDQERDRETISRAITRSNETALHIALRAQNPYLFVEKCVELMSTLPNGLAMKNNKGFTALSNAAVVGNTAAARLMVGRDRSLLYIKDEDGRLPLHLAAYYCQRETLEYLQNVTLPGVEVNIRFRDEAVAGFWSHPDLIASYLTCLIASGFFDLALEFAKRDNKFALKGENRDAPLLVLVKVPNAFRSTCRHLNFLENLIYKGVPTSFNPCSGIILVFKILLVLGILLAFWILFILVIVKLVYGVQLQLSSKILVPLFWILVLSFITVEVIIFIYMVSSIKKIHSYKLFHHQAFELVKCLCHAIKSSNNDAVQMMNTKEAVMEAARRGVHEVIEKIVDELPFYGCNKDEDNHFIFQMAVVNRCEKVFNLIFQKSRWKDYMLDNIRDEFNNNILHMAAMLPPPDKLNPISGAALQMRRELQWFKAVQRFVPRSKRENLNADNKTPRMVFTEQHKDLVISGEKWMKKITQACTITAVLITTVLFAAAINIPGGRNVNTGHPYFAKKNAYKIFAFADTFSFSTSTMSLFIFLAILTSRYSEEDFLTLPVGLTIGLISQIFSIMFMLVAYSAIVYLMFDEKELPLIIELMVIPTIAVVVFTLSQLPLHMTIISSTFSRSIFVEQSKRRFLF